MFNALDVAYYVIAYSNIVCRQNISNFKLNKILYCIQRAHLKRYDAPFFVDDIKIYGFGPAVPDVWLGFCHYGGKPIPVNYRHMMAQLKEKTFSIKDKNFIDEVVDKYIDVDNYDWFTLFDANSFNTVWGQMYSRGEGLFDTIPLEFIKEEQEFVFDEQERT